MMIDFFHDIINWSDFISVFQDGYLVHTVNKGWTIFNIPFMDMHDFLKLIFKFSFFIFFLTILVRYIYNPHSQKKSYLTTYFLIGIMVFLISITLENVKLELGFALGLFAIFGIIRYRTDAILIKEMTYLIAVIGLAVMNALGNKKVSLAELLFVNSAFLVIAYELEHLWLVKNLVARVIIYDRIELIKPGNYKKLYTDLSKRTGLNINRISFGNIDILKDTARNTVCYFEGDQQGFYNPEFNDSINRGKIEVEEDSN